MLLAASVAGAMGIVGVATQALDPADHDMALLFAGSFGALAALGVGHATDRIVLRRVKAMLAATERLRGGDFSARTGVSYGRTEICELAREFDGMAAALQQQQADRVCAEDRLRLSEARKSAVLEASFDGILLLDGLGTVLECNAAARALFGCDGRRCVHHGLSDLFPRELPFDSARFNRPAEAFETSGRRLDGSEFPVEMSIAPIRDRAAHGLFVATVRDMTARKRLERSLENLSFQDELTGVYNRRGFLMFAAQQMKVAARNENTVVLVSVDFDGLKRVNDHFGHANGDRALVELADALRASFRETDVIGRLGGDEFLVLAPETDHVGAEQALERLAKRLASRNASGDLPWTLSASVGWLRTDPAQGVSLGELLARVDGRMYAHKRGGRGLGRAAPAWCPTLEPSPARPSDRAAPATRDAVPHEQLARRPAGLP